jgi:flagellar M-ring protein FliF
VRQAGAIRRISVAVLIDGITSEGTSGEAIWEPRPVAEIKSLRDLVVAAIGFDEARGDVVTVESMAFQPDATPGELVEAGRWVRILESNAMTLIQIAVLASVILILALTVVRPILTRRPLVRPSIGAIAGPAPNLGEPAIAGALPQPIQPGLPPPADGSAQPAPNAEMLRLAVSGQPDQAVTKLQDWLAPAELASANAALAQ